MTSFLAFALYLSFSCLLLVAVPVMMHPTLPKRRKWIISILSFLVLVPAGLVIYIAVGVPQLSNS